MKKSKFFDRVFVSTLLLYLFFIITSFFVGYYETSNFIYYNLGLCFAMTLFYLLSVGFRRKEYNAELKRLVKETAAAGRFIR